MPERRRATDTASFMAKHLPLILQALTLLVVGAMAWATLNADLKYLRRDVDELRARENYVHGTFPIPGAK